MGDGITSRHFKRRAGGVLHSPSIAGWCLQASIIIVGVATPIVCRGEPPRSAPAATPAPNLSLADAVAYADAHYPSVKAALEQKTVAQRNVDLARDAYLPQVNLLWQINRATVNNFNGVLLPQSVIPPVSGPVLPQTGRTDWNSGAGVLLDWRVFDFGVRRAHVDAARAMTTAAEEDYELTRLNVEAATAAAYLNVEAAQALADTARRTWTACTPSAWRCMCSWTTSCGRGSRLNRRTPPKALAKPS
jgi:outer membrane protein TolC